MQIVLQAAKCSQMTNPKSGTGSGGDRCSEAIAAMIDATYKIGPRAQRGDSVESIMFSITEEWNQGRDVSGLEPLSRITSWVESASGGSIKCPTQAPNFAQAESCIKRGHVAIILVNDYRQLRLQDGGNPYHWDVSRQAPAGHFVLLVGIDDESRALDVHDPLRADPSGMPAWYSLASVERAGWNMLAEIDGHSLLPPAPPEPEQTHVVRPGESLWRIAEEEYHLTDPAQIEEAWPVIWHANPRIGGNPDMLSVNQVLVIPKLPASVSS